MKKKVDFCIGIFDNLTDEGLVKIKNDIKNCEIYGIGVYTDKIVIEDFFTYPINNLEKRMEIAKSIDGVRFVFPLDTNKPEELKEIIRKETIKIMEQNNLKNILS